MLKGIVAIVCDLAVGILSKGVSENVGVFAILLACYGYSLTAVGKLCLIAGDIKITGKIFVLKTVR